MKLTDERLKELLAISEAATPGLSNDGVKHYEFQQMFHAPLCASLIVEVQRLREQVRVAKVGLLAHCKCGPTDESCMACSYAHDVDDLEADE